MFLWITVAVVSLMVVAAVLGSSGRSTTVTALSRLAFAILLITAVISLAIYAS